MRRGVFACRGHAFAGSAKVTATVKSEGFRSTLFSDFSRTNRHVQGNLTLDHK
jgi:hypothetical protein